MTKYFTFILFFFFLRFYSFSQTTWSEKFSDAIVSRYQPTIDAMTGKGWEYSNGIILHGMEKVYLKTNNATYLNYIKAYIDTYVDASGNVTGLGTTLDKIQPGILCLFLYEQTGQLKYKTAATNIKNYLLSTSPVNFQKTAEGGYWHKNDGNYNNVMLIDGMYMLNPFLVKYASLFNDPTLYDVSTFQMILLASKVMPIGSNLPKHAYDYSKTKVWANGTTGVSSEVWSRATGWYMMALVDVLQYLPTTHADYNKLLEIFQRMCTGVAAGQNTASGLWYQVMDKPAETGNWLESSGSGMFVYALKKGIDKGWISNADYANVVTSAWTGMQSKIGTYTDGKPQIKNFCVATGVQNNAAAYIALGNTSSPVATGTQHPHGYCGILMAASAMEFNPSVNISSPTQNSNFTTPANINIFANASPTVGTINKVQFFKDDVLLGEDSSTPYEFNWTNAPQGNYLLTAKAIDSFGSTTTSSKITISIAAGSVFSISKSILNAFDDAEEFTDGTMTRTSYQLEMAYYSTKAGNQIIGLRFNNILVPSGVNITNAYIQFSASNTNFSPAQLSILGEKVNNSGGFILDNFNLTSRPKTSANLVWTPSDWVLIGDETLSQKTLNIASVIQEIIGLPGWVSGNSLSIFVTGLGVRAAFSYEGNSSKAPKLTIEYTN